MATGRQRPHPSSLTRSVVRVCGARTNGVWRASSAGYWNYRDEELVLYDDKGGAAAHMGVLNHEAFHQYIFYFYGNLAPHSWYNEGTGDFFWVPLKAGASPQALRLARPDHPRRDQVGRLRADAGVPPLHPAGVLRRGRQELRPRLVLIYFLRTGKKNAKGWNSDWDSILDDYLNALNDAWIEVKVQNILKNGVEFGEDGRISVDFSNSDEDDARAKAVDIAIAGIDWEEFEAAKAYTSIST